MIRTFLQDTRRIAHVCGTGVALRWLGLAAVKFPACYRARNLQPLDRAMGNGPFAVRLGKAQARLVGQQVFGGVRELWGRNVYLEGGFVSIPPNAVVVDLGANMGNFTMLALGHDPGVRVVAVEPSRHMQEQLRGQLAENGWTDRVQICGNFIGSHTPTQEAAINSQDAYKGVGYISEAEFIQQYGLERIDFLKCDIEGSEFGLLTAGSRILQMTQQIAIEVHDRAGDRQAFLQMLRDAGFEVRVTRDSGSDCIVQAKRRTAA